MQGAPTPSGCLEQGGNTGGLYPEESTPGKADLTPEIIIECMQHSDSLWDSEVDSVTSTPVYKRGKYDNLSTSSPSQQQKGTSEVRGSELQQQAIREILDQGIEACVP